MSPAAYQHRRRLEARAAKLLRESRETTDPSVARRLKRRAHQVWLSAEAYNEPTDGEAR